MQAGAFTREASDKPYTADMLRSPPLGTAEQAFADFLPTLKVLNVGCGNSILPEEMYDLDGYRHIYNMDISQYCIDAMKQRNQDTRPELVCKYDRRGLF